MKLQDYSNEPIRRGPITMIMNGKGVRPWLLQKICDPEYVYVVTKAMTLFTPAGPSRRVCYRCVDGVCDHSDGHTTVTWEENAPDPSERCPRCVRSFGERPAPN